MIQGSQNDMMADQGAVADDNAALILKTAARIHKHVFPEMDIFSEIGIKGREHREGFINGVSCQPAHQITDLFWRVIGTVEFSGNTHGFVTHFDHEFVEFRSGMDRQSVIDMGKKIIEIHDVPVIDQMSGFYA